ncbi:hypothetical protein QBC42DRAFT_276732 [Cladorrhinum samala]|uniref:CBF1-interacting co-repressor CIR N-terminal domain-containing protein n=1 Tax=Cladorrhinum samala TaxID=585594 RepID=A0AAV9HCB3_9PEZI|nr:hypothetical protein QBC42DRAFT_276732 [Cladorrhinum samala]
MPLHLLGKKSWNVYNADNVARVRRDEAAAKAKEEAEEQRMQEEDAERRLAILRGEVPPPLEDAPPEEDLARPSKDRLPFEGRKRKRAGEDDTDFEMRVAKERAEAGSRATRDLAPRGGDSSLVDSKGHITLFAEAQLPPEKNEEAEREAAQKQREYMDQYQMRMANAAGRDGQGLTKDGPWYASADGEASTVVPSKNVFGKDDPQRKLREATRLDASDPLAMMKKAAAKVRELDKERKKLNEERERELEALRKEEKRERRRRRGESERAERSQRHHEDDTSRDRQRNRERRRSRSRERERLRSRDRDRHRSRDRDRHRSRDRDRQRSRDRDRHRSRDGARARSIDRDRSRSIDRYRGRDEEKDRRKRRDGDADGHRHRQSDGHRSRSLRSENDAQKS